MKKNLKYLIYVLLTGLIVYACVSEFDGPGIEEKELMAESRNWFESNKGSMPSLRMAGENGQADFDIAYEPKWEYYFTQKEGNYNSVEYSLTMEKRLTVLHPTVKELYEQTGDDKYLLNSMRYVYLADRKTGTPYGFIMVIAPSLEYMEATGFKPFRKMSYLERNDIFGGFVLYYTLDGNFVNGWVYEDGEVISSLEFVDKPEEEPENHLRSYSCTISSITYGVQVCVDYYVTYENSPDDGIYGTNCDSWSSYTYYTQTCTGTGGGSGGIIPPDPGLGGGGGSGGGSGGSSSNGGAYTPSVVDKMAKANLPTTMDPQLPNSCVTAIMEYMNNKVWNGNINEGVYIQAYMQMTGKNPILNGINMNYLGQFIMQFFHTAGFNSIKAVIDSGGVVMTDIPSSIAGSSHNVLIVGYQPNGNYICMDPEKGYMTSVNKSSIGQNYTINIIGVKNNQ